MINFTLETDDCLRSYIVMNFGGKGYQHRFFNTPSPKKKTIFSPTADSILPLLYPHHLPSPTSTNYNLSQYHQYLHNAANLEAFKRNAEYNRLKKRLAQKYGQLPPIHPMLIEPLPSHTQALVDRLNHQKRKLAEELERVSHERNHLYDSFIEQRELVWNYRRKYDKVRGKLREEKKRYKRCMREQQDQNEKQKSRINKLQHSMECLNLELQNNSVMLQRALRKAQSQQVRKRQQISVGATQQLLFPNKPQLGMQYDQMSRLKQQIVLLDKQLQHSRKTTLP